ncbi:MAG: DUF1540 domain-containing protein [bacterium]
MEITIETAEVTECAARSCAYNREGGCHARAITIGDGVHPMCDTFLPTDGSHCRASSAPSGVGACKVASCQHNEDFECQAERIALGAHSDHADCITFAPA